MKIFAYGSNMCTARLQARVPSARPVGVAALPGHALRFHKRGWRDGSGKADAARCGDAGAVVHGVVFRLDPVEKAALDWIEGLGRGYDERGVRVTAPDGVVHEAWMYQAARSAIDPAAVPFRWYRDLVLAGAREHGLPDDYVRNHIVACPTCPDPNGARARRHRALAVGAPATGRYNPMRTPTPRTSRSKSPVTALTSP
jgi:hypothetical protein